MTVAITVAVTAYGCWEKEQFRIPVGMAFVFAMTMMWFFILSLIWGMWAYTALCGLFVVLYGLFLLCDT